MFKRANNPGPNIYKLPTTLSGVGITMGKKINNIEDYDSPGPAVHGAVPLNNYKYKAPQHTISKKFEDPLWTAKISDDVPGPLYYPTLKFKYNVASKFSFGKRRPEKFPPLVVCADNEGKTTLG